MSNIILESYLSGRVRDADFESRLKRLSLAEAEIVSQLISQLEPSANMLKALLELADDIIGRDALSLQTLFQAQPVQSLLTNEKLNRKSKASELRKYLETLRFPEMNKVRSEIEQLVTELRNEYKMQLVLPNEYEGERLNFAVSFRNAEELTNNAEKQLQLSQDARLTRVFALLRGEY